MDSGPGGWTPAFVSGRDSGLPEAKRKKQRGQQRSRRGHWAAFSQRWRHKVRVSAQECHKTALRPDFDEILTQPALTVTHWRGTRSFLERFTLFFYFPRVLDTFVWQVCVLGWTDTSCIQTARNSMCSYRNVYLWRCLKMSSSQLKNSQKTLWVIEMPSFVLKTGSELYWRSRSFTKWGPALEDTQELLLLIIV